MGHYDSISKGYDELHGEEQSKKAGIIRQNIEVSKDTKILDVGCGTGLSSGFDCFVAGIDPSIRLLRLNNNRLRLQAAAESLPFKDGSFDYVISVTAIHNFDDLEKALEEIKRVCRGKFVFSILKKSGKFSAISSAIRAGFNIRSIIEEDKDAIFFCDPKK